MRYHQDLFYWTALISGVHSISAQRPCPPASSPRQRFAPQERRRHRAAMLFSASPKRVLRASAIRSLSKWGSRCAASTQLRTASSSPGHEDDASYYLAPTLARVQQQIREKKGACTNPPAAEANNDDDGSRGRSSLFIDGGLAASRLGLDPRKNTRHAPMVYHDRYSPTYWPPKHTFPMAKFNMTAVSLLSDPDEFLEDQPGTPPRDGRGGPLVHSRDDFYRPLSMGAFPKSFMCPPICPDFLEAFLSGSLSPEECRVVGFREQTSRPELVERTVLEVAGTVLTAQLALRYGLASNLAGGTHHADSTTGKGFTILNDLATVARLMTWNEDDFDSSGDHDLLRQFYRGNNVVDRVLVVDCDVHQGDGTATFSSPPGSPGAAAGANNLHGRLFTLDLHCTNNYPHPKETCTYDVGLPDECDDEAYLSALDSSLEVALDEVQPQLVLYNAGVDVFVSDKLGRLSLSWEGMKRRDLHVIETCVGRGIPVAAVVGGGYDNDVRVLGRRHALVHRVCAHVWRQRQMWMDCY